MVFDFVLHLIAYEHIWLIHLSQLLSNTMGVCFVYPRVINMDMDIFPMFLINFPCKSTLVLICWIQQRMHTPSNMDIKCHMTNLMYHYVYLKVGCIMFCALCIKLHWTNTVWLPDNNVFCACLLWGVPRRPFNISVHRSKRDLASFMLRIPDGPIGFDSGIHQKFCWPLVGQHEPLVILCQTWQQMKTKHQEQVPISGLDLLDISMMGVVFLNLPSVGSLPYHGLVLSLGRVLPNNKPLRRANLKHVFFREHRQNCIVGVG